MVANIASALHAYDQAVKSVSTNGAVVGGVSDGAAEGPSFASFLETGARSAIGVVKAGEEQSKLAIAGKADIRDVVLAVNNAEVTLQTVVTVRDKVIGAYNDILKMAI